MSAFQEYWRLLGLHIRMRLSLSALGGKGVKRSGKQTAKMIGFGLIILYAVGAILLVYSLVLFPFLRGMAEAGLQILAMGTIVLICMILVMVFGTLTLLTLVFGARDAEAYAALPLREQSVFAAKFTMAYGIEMGITALFLWPAIVIYGIVSELAAMEFILLALRAVPVWLLLPMAPMALAALISMLFTRLMALTKRRDTLLMVFGMVLVFGLVVGQSFLMGRFMPVLENEEQLTELLSDSSATLEAVTRAFPPSMWCSQALAEENAAKAGMGFLGMTASAAAGGAFCLLLSRRLYYKGVLAQLEAPRGKKKGFRQDAVKMGSALGAFFFKEMKTILRTPVYAMNILTGVVIFPVMFAALSFIPGGGASGQLAEMIENVTGEGQGDVLYLLAGGIVMLTAVMGSVCVSTTFSREGKMLWVSQTVPVPARTQLAGRLLVGFALTAAGALLSMAMLVVFLGFSVPQAVFGLIAGLCAAFPILTAAVIPDTLKPKRKWNSESEAIKQNFNSILAMLIGFGVAIAIAAAAYALQLFLSVWAAGAVAAACLIVGVAIFGYTARIADNMMKTIDS